MLLCKSSAGCNADPPHSTQKLQGSLRTASACSALTMLHPIVCSVLQNPAAFDFKRDYLYQDQLYDLRGRPATPQPGVNGQAPPHRGLQWALLTFQQPVTAPQACACAYFALMPGLASAHTSALWACLSSVGRQEHRDTPALPCSGWLVDGTTGVSWPGRLQSPSAVLALQRRDFCSSDVTCCRTP